MAEHFDLVIRGGICLTPSGRVESDIGVRDGRVTAIGNLGISRVGSLLDRSQRPRRLAAHFWPRRSEPSQFMVACSFRALIVVEHSA